MKRRDMMKNFVLGTAAGHSVIFGKENEAIAQTYSKQTRGMPPLKIKNVKAIGTAPEGIPLVVVKVETSEPGLYGVGCASWRQRPLATITNINEYLSHFAKGKDADNIEDLWQSSYMSSYFRNGPVTNAAISGLDMALWDIKGKRADMPVYQLLGGKCRFAVDTYASVGGRDFHQVEDNVRKHMEQGFRYIRLHISSRSPDSGAHFKDAGFGMSDDQYHDLGPKVRALPKLFEHLRNTCGEEIELMHECSTQPPPIVVINMLKEVEQYHPFFIEDPLSPEDNGYFELLRQQTCVPLAQGELFTNPHEWTGLISEKLIDFIRCHISCIGGITPALKLARFAEVYNVRTAWHGPAAVSPVGHAANAHLDLVTWNFGIQEFRERRQEAKDVFPGCPTIENGYMNINEVPGLGVDIDEKLAKKFPIPDRYGNMPPERKKDGTIIKR
ncbi:enolase C-terminal domain-like protein [Candidatus Latescibacterota bacterium]